MALLRFFNHDFGQNPNDLRRLLRDFVHARHVEAKWLPGGRNGFTGDSGLAPLDDDFGKLRMDCFEEGIQLLGRKVQGLEDALQRADFVLGDQLVSCGDKYQDLANPFALLLRDAAGNLSNRAFCPCWMRYESLLKRSQPLLVLWA